MTNESSLKELVERIERQAENVRAEQDVLKEIYSESKALGYDVKILRKLVAERRREAEEVEEEYTILDLYRNALL